MCPAAEAGKASQMPTITDRKQIRHTLATIAAGVNAAIEHIDLDEKQARDVLPVLRATLERVTELMSDLGED